MKVFTSREHKSLTKMLRCLQTELAKSEWNNQRSSLVDCCEALIQYLKEGRRHE
jgi:hypothetical protein